MPDPTTIAFTIKRIFRDERGPLEALASLNPLEAAGLMAVIMALTAVAVAVWALVHGWFL